MSDAYELDQNEPYDRDENAFRTDGGDVCHWCSARPQDWLWQPYRTRVCEQCQETIDRGEAWRVVEEAAARITVRDGWRRWGAHADPERWRRRALINRWLEVRTSCERIIADTSD